MHYNGLTLGVLPYCVCKESSSVNTQDTGLKGTVHPQMKNLQLFTHPCFVPHPLDLLSSLGNIHWLKRSVLNCILCA